MRTDLLAIAKGNDNNLVRPFNCRFHFHWIGERIAEPLPPLRQRAAFARVSGSRCAGCYRNCYRFQTLTHGV
jgi:hypothetical protein